MNLRTICYRAFCDACGEFVSAAPRMTEEQADSDFAAHVNICHEGGSHDSRAIDNG